MSTVKSQTAGLDAASVVHLSRTLSTCQNQQSNVLHVEFTCVPGRLNLVAFKYFIIFSYLNDKIDSAPGIDIYTMGGAQQSVNTIRGIIQTPGYPSYQTNQNNQISININGNNKLAYIYNVNTYIQAASLLGA